MLDFCVADIVRATGSVLQAGESTVRVSSVAIDSRQVTPGTLFVCIAGERVDGNDFAGAAVDAGAAAVVMTREPSSELVEFASSAGCAVLRANDDDPEEFMLRLAEAWRARNPQWAVVGVTGSVGKTTTKDMLAAGLGACWRVHATAGNYNNLLGVPLTLLSASVNDEVVVCEMGMNHAGELARLTQVVRPTVALITNVGTSHIGYLGSREGIARAKAEIVAGIPASGEPVATCIGSLRSCLVLSSDNDFAPLIEDEYCRPAEVDVLYVGSGAGHAMGYANITTDDDGKPSFELIDDAGSSRHLSLEVAGVAPVIDAVFALAVCRRLGADLGRAAEAICTMPATHMRLEVVGGGTRPRIIDDSYNASPTSVASALSALASMSCEGRRIAVLGEIGELGDQAQRLHELVGAYVAALAPDLVVWVGGQNAEHMREAARIMGLSDDHMELFSDAASALEVIGPVLLPDDLVMVKGSRSVGLDSFVRGVLA